ncbi:MAG: S8 family peptidase [Nocardioides sp.]
MSRPRSLLAALVVALCVTALLQAPGGAAPAEVQQRRSTRVAMPTPDGRLSSYVVNAAKPWGENTRKVKRAVRRTGGVVVRAWPQIGVVVAHSRRGGFRDALRRRPFVGSVGATRTTRVLEGTPGRPGDAPRARPAAPAIVKQEYRPVDAAQVEPDPRESEQWDMSVVKADQAHEITDGSPDVVVGVLDSGIAPGHPDLEANIDTEHSVNCTDAGRVDTSRRGWRPTGIDHGTHVAGTVAAARNGVGIVGVAPDARIASVKVVNDSGLIYAEYAICGFMWAGLQRMDVTNNSYYIDPFMYWCSDRRDQRAVKRAVTRAVAWSTGRGVTHVAAAGNASTDLTRNTRDWSSPNDSRPVDRRINAGCHDLPTELPGVLTVSSFAQVRDTLNTRLSAFSNVGLGVIDVGAPGSDVLSTVTGDRYAHYSGTSMASPHVAGVVALLAGVHPEWTPEQLTDAVREQADDKPCRRAEWDGVVACVGTDEDNSYAGEGMLDALEAVSP